ncbi:MAG: hypothetical protein ABW221_12620 [Vicinamibacteria bacterium]
MSGPPVRRFVPAEGRIDRNQLGALLRLQLAQMLRRGTDRSSGTSGNPLRQIVFSMTFLGLLAVGGAFRDGPLDLFLARIFGGALVIVALMVSAESDDARIRRMEILLPKPIAGATHVASFAAQLLLMSALIVLPYALPPLVAACFRLGLSPALVPVLLLTLLAGAFALVLVWVLVIRAGVERLGADRIRMATQLCVVSFMLLLAWSGLSAATGSTLGPPALPERVLRALPSSWLAGFWTDGWDGAANLRRAAVVGLMASSVAGFLLFARRASVDALFETTSRTRRTRAPLLARVLVALARRPGFRLLLPPPAAALAACILTLGRREEASRLRGFATMLLAVAMAAWGLLADAGPMPLAVLASFLVSIGQEGLAVTRQSADGAAAWAIAKAPLKPAHDVRAVQWAVMARFALLPLALFAVLAFQRHPWHLAALFVAGGLGVVRLVVASACAAHPAYPLGEAPVVTGMIGQVTGWALGIAGALAYVVGATLADLLGWFGAVLVGVGVIVTIGLSVAAQIVAAHRLARLETPA